MGRIGWPMERKPTLRPGGVYYSCCPEVPFHIFGEALWADRNDARRLMFEASHGVLIDPESGCTSRRSVPAVCGSRRPRIFGPLWHLRFAPCDGTDVRASTVWPESKRAGARAVSPGTVLVDRSMAFSTSLVLWLTWAHRSPSPAIIGP